MPYVSKCPEGTAARLREVLSSGRRLYFVGNNGPTSFVVRETVDEDDDGRTFRVLIGSRQYCSCGGVDAEHSVLCVHVLFVMVKVLRVPAENPMVWQLSLVDGELESVLAFRYTMSRREHKRHDYLRRRSGGAGCATIPPQAQQDDGLIPLGCADDSDDVCPVCLDELRGGLLTYCVKSCGRLCHVRCMLEYARHHNGCVKCPLCRENWGGEEVVAALRRRLSDEPRRGKPGSETHLVRCSHCRARPIVGERFRCATCVGFDLCSTCFGHGVHPQHLFAKKGRVGDAWIAAPRLSRRRQGLWRPAAGLAAAGFDRESLAALQFRDLESTDYSLLLGLDEPMQESELVFSSLGVYLAQLLREATTAMCVICGRDDATTSFVCCGSRAHRDCVAHAIDAGNFGCASCGQPIAPGLAPRPKRRPLDEAPQAVEQEQDRSSRLREWQRAEQERLLQAAFDSEERRLKAKLVRERATAAAARARRVLLDRKMLQAGERRAAARDAPDLFVGNRDNSAARIGSMRLAAATRRRPASCELSHAATRLLLDSSADRPTDRTHLLTSCDPTRPILHGLRLLPPSRDTVPSLESAVASSS